MEKSLIKAEGIRLLYTMGVLKAPNSPNGTHYMAALSMEFVHSANSNDMDTLINFLSKYIPDCSMSTIDGIKGIYLFSRQPYIMKRYELEPNGGYEVYKIVGTREYTLLMKGIPELVNSPQPFVVAWRFTHNKGKCYWGQGCYRENLKSAIQCYIEKTGDSM